jgi:hypothetical protein
MSTDSGDPYIDSLRNEIERLNACLKEVGPTVASGIIGNLDRVSQELYTAREHLADARWELVKKLAKGEDESSTSDSSQPSQGPRLTPEQYDILCYYLHEDTEISEGYLREMMKVLYGWGGHQTRVAWFDAVERGRRLEQAYTSQRHGAATPGIPAPPRSSSEITSGPGSDSPGE